MTDDLDLEHARRAVCEAIADVDAARQARDNAIRRAAAVGLSLRTIAEAVGVSHETVRRIIGQETT